MGFGGRNLPVGSRGESPVGGLGSLPEAEAVCRHWLQILTTETIKIWKLRTVHLVRVCFTVGG